MSLDDGLLIGANDGLLVTESSLPMGTSCFHSRYRWPNKLTGFACASAVAAGAAVVCAIATAGNGGKLPFAVIAALTIVGSTVATVVFRHFDYGEYRQKVEEENWLQGLFLFPSGELVVRLDHLFTARTDMIIEGRDLQRAGLKTGPGLCGPQTFIEIHCENDQGQPAVHLVPCSRLVEQDHRSIVAAINESVAGRKRRDSTGSGQGGGDGSGGGSRRGSGGSDVGVHV